RLSPLQNAEKPPARSDLSRLFQRAAKNRTGTLATPTAQAWANASVKTRGGPLGLGVHLDVPAAGPATALPAVAAAAPATTLAVAPTALRGCLRRWTDGSRTPTPQGSQPAFAGGEVATPIRPLTGRPSLVPCSSTRCPCRSSYDSPCCPQ